MYTTSKSGQATVAAVATPPSAYRRNLLDLLAAAPVITSAEYDTATARILACASLLTLERWHRNCLLEIARRQQALDTVQPAPVANDTAALVGCATAAQTSEVHQLALHRVITERERTAVMHALPTLDAVQATRLIGELWAKVLHRTQAHADTAAPVLLPRYSQAACRNRWQADLLELRATLPAAIAAYDRARAGRAVLAHEAPTYYLENVAQDWDLEEQGSRLNTSALLLGFADLAEARRALPLLDAALPEWGAPAEVSYFQAC